MTFIVSDSCLILWGTDQLDPISNIALETDFQSRIPTHKISPDEQFVAIQITDEILLLSLPDLEQVDSIQTPGWANWSLGWSPDSRFLGAAYSPALLVWDVESDTVFHREFGFESGIWEIVPFSMGWILGRFLEDEPAFVVCDYNLTNCSMYEYEDHCRFISISYEGGVILVERQTPNGIIAGLWTRQTNGAYVLSREISRPELRICYFSELSLTGAFLYHSSAGTVWDIETMTVLHQLDRPRFPIWFLGDDYFITVGAPSSTFLLHRTGQQEPIDELQPYTLSAPNLNQLLEEAEGELPVLDFAPQLTVDKQGRFVLVNMGYTILVIPIEYK